MAFSDRIYDVRLDALLPRLVELAEKGERRSKLAAAEALHALVIWTVGKGAELMGRADAAQSDPPFLLLYRHVLPAVLRLGTDVERCAPPPPLPLQRLSSGALTAL
jgi:hypothetical protein